MPSSKEPRYSNLELLRACGDPTYKPQPMTARELETSEEARKFLKLYEIRRAYKWEWNAGAKYLYSELIRAYGLDSERQEMLMKMAKPTPGRKHGVDKAIRIAQLKRQGMTAKQIAELLKREGHAISVEGVESYLKRRREPSLEEQARAAVEHAFSKSKKSS